MSNLSINSYPAAYKTNFSGTQKEFNHSAYYPDYEELLYPDINLKNKQEKGLSKGLKFLIGTAAILVAAGVAVKLLVVGYGLKFFKKFANEAEKDMRTFENSMQRDSSKFYPKNFWNC